MKKGEGLYPGKMAAVIQKHLIINKLNWTLVEGTEFEELRMVLNNVMQEYSKFNIGPNC